MSSPCYDRWVDCDLDCANKYPDDPLMREGCEDSCEAAYDLCKLGGGVGGVVAL